MHSCWHTRSTSIRHSGDWKVFCSWKFSLSNSGIVPYLSSFHGNKLEVLHLELHQGNYWGIFFLWMYSKINNHLNFIYGIILQEKLEWICITRKKTHLKDTPLHSITNISNFAKFVSFSDMTDNSLEEEVQLTQIPSDSSQLSSFLKKVAHD